MKSPQDRCPCRRRHLWLVAVLGKMPPALGKVWLLVSMALGVAFIWAMTLVYQIDTVPTRYNGYTTLAFFLTAFLCGPVFAALLLRIARVPFCSVTFASISGPALVVCVAVIVLQGLSLNHSQFRATGQPSRTGLRYATGLAHCLACCRIRLLAMSANLSPRTAYRWFAARCRAGAGRRNYWPRTFYGLHMTIGMAVAG